MIKIISNDLLHAEKLDDPETERPVKTFQVIIEQPICDDTDMQQYFAYTLFKEAKFVVHQLINSMPLLSGLILNEDAGKRVSVYEVRCTYRSLEEINDYRAYGDPEEDFYDD